MKRAIILVAIAGLLSLLLFVRVSGHEAWLMTALNASHGPIFAGVTVLMLAWLEPKAGRPPYLRIFLVAVLLGVLIEFLQSLEGRPPSAFDVMTDSAGASAALGLWALIRARRTTTRPATGGSSPWLPVAIATAGITFIAWYPLQAARAYAHRAAVFPSVAQFRGPLDLAFVTTDGVDAAIRDLPVPWGAGPADRALRIAYDGTHAPAVQVLEPSPDWRGYSVVAVDLTNPAPRELRLIFRILDEKHDWSHEDRLNLPLTIPPQTRTTVRVALSAVEAAPAHRRMDLSRIANVMLFGRESPDPAELYVSRIWLE